MSRRSVLLATTFYIAIGSLVAAGPASAHGFGFGGFGGGASFAMRSPPVASIARAPIPSMGSYGGGRFGHAPSIAESSGAGARLQPSRIPAIANAPLGNGPAAASSIRPAQVPPLIAGNQINQIKNISAAEGRGKLPKSGTSNDVPNVAGEDVLVMGQGQAGGIPKVPGVKIPDGPAVNLPGSQFGQKGPREVPGFGNGTGGAASLNLPGAVDRHGPDDAGKKLGELEKPDQQLLDNATKGGPNSVNIPTAPGAGIAVSDDTSAKKSGSGGTGKTGSSGNPLSAGGGVYGSGGTAPTKDGGTVTVSTMQDKGTTYQVVTTKDAAGNITSMTYSEKGKDGKIKTTSTGPEIPAKKDKTPNEDDTTGTIGSLNPNSGVGKTGHGGGTDNNGTETSVASSQLANGTSLGSKGNGDGTGNHGDNNGVDKGGALAAGTSLARKDNGDGGGSDTRDGGTSLGAPKVHPGGGNPSQLNLKGAAAMAD